MNNIFLDNMNDTAITILSLSCWQIMPICLVMYNLEENDHRRLIFKIFPLFWIAFVYIFTFLVYYFELVKS